jgi:hypothetical protein
MRTENTTSDKILKMVLLAINLFFIVAWLSPAYWNWSVFHIEPVRTIGFFVIPINLILILSNRAAEKLGGKVAGFLVNLSKNIGRLPFAITLPLWIILPLAVLYVLRMHIHIYGDGYNIIGSLTNRSMIAPIYNGVSVVYTALAELCGATEKHQCEFLMSMCSIAAGSVLIFFTYKSLILLIDNCKLHPLSFLIAITCGFIVLFTGYIENYPFVVAWLSVYIYISIRVVKKAGRLRSAIIALVIGIFLHFGFIAFFPSLLMLINYKKRFFPAWVVYVLSALYVIGIYVGGQVVKRGPYTLTNPLLTGDLTNYTLLGTPHFVDFANILMIVGPVMPFVSLLVIVLLARSKISPTLEFMIMASIPAFFIAFTIDPILGAMRDWDLLSFYALPLVLTGLAGIPIIIKSVGRTVAIMLPILILNCLHLGGFVLTNLSPETAIDNCIRIIRDDPHYETDYYHGHRIQQFSAILNKVFNKKQVALELMRRIENVPEADYEDMAGLARLYCDMEDYQNAVRWYGKIEESVDFNLGDRAYYGISLFECGQLEPAIHQFKMMSRDTVNAGIFLTIGLAYMNLGEPDSAQKYYDISLDYSEDSIYFMTMFRDLFYGNGSYAHAANYQRRLIEIFPDSVQLKADLDAILEPNESPPL